MVEHTGGIVAVERLHVMDPRHLYPGIAPDIRTDEGVCKLIELFCQAAGITISGKRFVQGSLF